MHVASAGIVGHRPPVAGSARIFRASRGVTQSGRARRGDWILEFEPTERSEPDFLMGWAASGDVLQQVRLSFPTKEQAAAFAERQGWECRIYDPAPVHPPRRSYSENFTGATGSA